MKFERGQDVKASLSLGLRGTMQELFTPKVLQFQHHIHGLMQSPSNWSFERRSWKKIPYYIVEVRNLKNDERGTTAWAFYIPSRNHPTADKVSLFYIEKKLPISEARNIIRMRYEFRKR